MDQEQFSCTALNILQTSLYNVHISVNFQITNIHAQKFNQGCARFAETPQNCTGRQISVAPTCMLSVLVCHTISAKRENTRYTEHF